MESVAGRYSDTKRIQTMIWTLKRMKKFATATACYMLDAYVPSIVWMANGFFCALAHSIPFHIFMTCNSLVNIFVHCISAFYRFLSLVLTQLFWAAAPAEPAVNHTPSYNFNAIFLFGWASIYSVHKYTIIICGSNVIAVYSQHWTLSNSSLHVASEYHVKINIISTSHFTQWSRKPPCPRTLISMHDDAYVLNSSLLS